MLFRSVLIMDFGGGVEGVEALESQPPVAPREVGEGETDAWVRRDEEERKMGWLSSRAWFFGVLCVVC